MCSLPSNPCAYIPVSTALEEAALYLDIADTATTADMTLSSLAWAALSNVLLPSAQTLRGLMLLVSPAKYVNQVCCLSAPLCHLVHNLLRQLLGNLSSQCYKHQHQGVASNISGWYSEEVSLL